MTNVFQSVAVFFAAALSGITVRNTVLVRAMGTSRLISLVDKTTSTAVFGVLLTLAMEMSCALNYFLYESYVRHSEYAVYLRPLCVVVCMTVSFLILLLAVAKLAPEKTLKPAIEALPPAAFNCTVLGTIILTVSNNMNLIQSLGFGFGSSVGFVLAVLLSTEIQSKLQNKDMPAAWKGMPATLLFLGALALAIYALTGYLPSVR